MNMLTRIRKWLAPPVFEDEDKTRTASLLNTILLSTLAIEVLVGIIVFFVSPSPAAGLVALGTAALLKLGALYIMHIGRVRLVSVLYSSAIWVFDTLLISVSGGMRGFNAINYVLVVIMVGLLLGGRAAIAFAGLSIVTGLGMVYADSHGLLPAPVIGIYSAGGWVALTANLIFAAGLLYLATRSINRALERARRNERALAESNRELQAEIAERVRAEQALRESEERFRSIVEQSKDGIVLCDEHGAIIEWNRGQEQITGLEQADVLGQPLWDVQFQVSTEERNTPAMYEQARTSMLGFLETGQAPWLGQMQEVAIMRPDGTHRIVQEVIFPIKTSKGFMAGGISRDVTERKQAEEALRESEEKYRDLVENVSDVIYAVDRNGVVTYVSPAIESLIGYHASEVIDRPFDTFIYREDVQRVKENVGSLFAGHSPGPSEYRVLNKSGEIRWIRTSSRPIFEGNRVVGIQGVLADITERVRAEEELERYRDHLEELVAERTRELEEAQAELVRQERLSALGQLTATVAHEIRNPLGTVRTAVFAIGDAIERDEMGRVEGALQLAERNIIRCDGIITELLDYTRDRVLQLEPMHIDTWLDVVLDERAIPEGIICIRELSAGVEVPIDREHLRRAIVNVVGNAVDALQDEASPGNQLTVSTRVVGNRLEIRVSDTGLGIPADVLPKVFEPLFSTKSVGVGLGLPIAKDIMEQHGGGIEIQSPSTEFIPSKPKGLRTGAVGQGTTVVLWLPIPNHGGG